MPSSGRKGDRLRWKEPAYKYAKQLFNIHALSSTASGNPVAEPPSNGDPKKPEVSRGLGTEGALVEIRVCRVVFDNPHQ